MTSTELNLGLSNTKRTSSRVLKPPGGGHSNIFAEAEAKKLQPRPKYDQQNSSNLNCVMNTTDPNIAIQKARENFEKIKIADKVSPKHEVIEQEAPKTLPVQPEPPSQVSPPEPKQRKEANFPSPTTPKEESEPIISPKINQENGSNNNVAEPLLESPKYDKSGRGRVPPGGFSSGFW